MTIPSDSSVSDALAILEPYLGCADGPPRSDPRWERLRAALERVPAAPEVPGLVARPCALPAALWHFEALAAAAERPNDGHGPVRRLYHARWLARLLAPAEPRFAAVVSIVIPVYNRARLVVEAVESCLRQTYAAIEIIVVDDGSTDDPAHALQPFRHRIILHCQPNDGVSSARNAGIRLAKGDFVHFLDSDNLLEPDAVAAKVAAFHAIADADLCFTGFRQDELGDSGIWPTEDLSCPTCNLLHPMALRHNLLISTVMMPRSLLLETGGFDESLRRGEDNRYWFTLGLRGAKAIGIRRSLMIRRRPPDALSLDLETPPVTATMIVFRNLIDVLGRPQLWSYASSFAIQLPKERWWPWLCEQDNERVRPWKARLIETVQSLGDGRARGGLSPLPLLFSFHQSLFKILEAGWRPPRDRRSFHHRTLAALRAAIATAAPLTAADLVYWYSQPFQASIDVAMARLWARAREQPQALGVHDLDALMRALARGNSFASIRLYRPLRTEVGHRAALALTRMAAPLLRSRADVPVVLEHLLRFKHACRRNVALIGRMIPARLRSLPVVRRIRARLPAFHPSAPDH